MPASQLQFAWFGAKGSGRTAYLASLYGSCGADQGGPAYHVAASDRPDDPTHDYLGRIYRKLEASQWPDPNAFIGLEKLSIRFAIEGLSRELVLPEVSGELAWRGDKQMAPGLKAEILAEYQDFHGFAIFVPADVTDAAKVKEFKWEVDVFLDALRERAEAAGRATIARPVAVLVTKWDLIEPGRWDEGSEARAIAFFETTYPDLASGLRTVCENVRVFPVSATGPLDAAGRPPSPLRPANLGEPIAWLVETAERGMLERALAQADRATADPFARLPGDGSGRGPTLLASARERMEEFLEQVPYGPLADEARTRLRALRAISARRLARLGGLAALAVASILVTVVGVRDYRASRRARDLLDGPPPGLSQSEVVSRLRPLVRGPFWDHPVGHILPFWRDLSRVFEKYEAAHEAQAFDPIAQRAHPSDEKEALALLERIKVYLADFPDSPRRDEVETFRVEADKVVREDADRRRWVEIEEDSRRLKVPPDNLELAKRLVEDCKAFLKELPKSRYLESVQKTRAEAQAVVDTIIDAITYEQLRRELAEAAKVPWRCYQLCLKFLEKYPAHRRRQEVEADRDSFLLRADDAAWGEVLRHAREFPTLFAEHITRADEYLNNIFYTKHREEAGNLKKQANRGLDRSAYEAIRTKAGDNAHSTTLQAVRNLCARYLESSNATKAMTTEVKRWADWFDEWGRGRTFYVDVASVRIDRGSAWHHWSYPNPWVHATAQVGSRSDSTGDRSITLDLDHLDLPEAQLGPFTWRWGNPDVTISLHHQGATPATFLARFDETDKFKVRYLNGTTRFDGGKIAVRLSCPDVVPPPLPPYQD